MKFTRLFILDVLLIEPKVFGDERGFFFESFNQNCFKDAIGRPIRLGQDNHSRSAKNVLPYLNYQIAPGQAGAHGAVFDVAVDPRKSSHTFGQWVGEILSVDNKRQQWVPESFAHYSVVLSRMAEFLYKTTDYYAPAHERCIAPKDPDIGIDGPQGIIQKLSEEDICGLSLTQPEAFD